MKFLIFALVFAFILEDRGIFSAKPIDQCSSDELIGLFRKYALELVSAAAKPLRKNGAIMEGGSKCISGIDMNVKADSIDAIVAMMSLAKDYHGALQLIRKSSNNSKVESNDGFMKNIRLILVILQSPPTIFNEFDRIRTFKRYLVKKKQNPYASGSNGYFESEIECFRALLSMSYGNNERFFDNLFIGLKIGNALMRDDDKDFDKDPDVKMRRAELNIVIQMISENDDVLETPPADYEKDAVDQFIENLSTKSDVSDFEFGTETDTDTDTDAD